MNRQKTFLGDLGLWMCSLVSWMRHQQTQQLLVSDRQSHRGNTLLCVLMPLLKDVSLLLLFKGRMLMLTVVGVWGM